MPRAYHHGNLRRTLLDAAVALFAERGAFDFTLRELARAAGVTHNAPYRHFAGKAELLEALRSEGFLALAEAAQASLAAAGDDPRKRVRALGDAYLRFAIDEPHRFRLMLHNPLGGADDPVVGQASALAILKDTLEEARRAGVVRQDLSARELALAAWALVHGLSSLMVAGQIPADDARVRRYGKLLETTFFEGIARR
ncbi:MAG: TetR/AcrR family transcriptional regulator [Myxococcales bacterium]|nr:TetR/AcrR family transcriptional regulator [Myxococcales bacterium]